jgi:hypothetical protein
MKKFNWKKFIIGLLISLPVLLLIDMGYDKFLGKNGLVLADTFAMKNLAFKILTALVIGYFYATLNSEPKEK